MYFGSKTNSEQKIEGEIQLEEWKSVLNFYHIVAYLPKAGNVNPAETAVARERLHKRPFLGNDSVAVA
jgi:hypothetical protein